MLLLLILLILDDSELLLLLAFKLELWFWWVALGSPVGTVILVDDFGLRISDFFYK